ncbi:DUF3263 domain-containing protein [Micromonospora endolithica]|uniref:DUF3263 domain-containing protein n=1 Tax=Micromonospora endolithica TaxID=230091 RepID=A0A3A9YTT6_9ACTN|nr:DUF3263 domain-containing protein [Micromonospora endolithica]TWJ25534.1 uncharacterized protein DUF3263 [Micromonospora endolithica]
MTGSETTTAPGTTGAETTTALDPATATEAGPGSASTMPEPTAAEGAAVPGSVASDGTTVGLTERERDILAFERQWWRHAGAKEQAVRDRFNLSATRYYQLLNGLLDNPAALAAEPLLIGRLRRLRSSRARNRRR